MADDGISRRELLQRSAFGVGGLAVGGLGGFLVGNATEDTDTGPRAATEGEPIRVVGIFPLTGVVAADGEEMRNGTVMAIDEINERGGLLGRPLEYIEIDDEDSFAEDITNAFRRAVDTENPDVIVSGYHLATGPEFDIVADANVLYYNLNTQTAWVELYETDPERYWSIFQVDPTEAWYGIGFARWLEDLIEQGQIPDTRRAAILRADDPYGSSIARYFEEEAQRLGWEIAGKETFTSGQVSDWGPLLSRVRGDDVAVLFSTDFSPAGNAAMVQQFVENPMPAVLYQQYGPSVPEYLELAGRSAEGVVWSTVLGRLPDPVGRAWVDAYSAKFGTEPGFANAPGNYDLIYTWAQGVLQAGDAGDYQRVAEETEKVVLRGITGGISFENHTGRQYPHQTEDPTLGQSQIIVQIQDGEHRTIFPAPYTDGEFRQPPWM
jgi:branched-chain amino acid transport system substrate-binding protein